MLIPARQATQVNPRRRCTTISFCASTQGLITTRGHHFLRVFVGKGTTNLREIEDKHTAPAAAGAVSPFDAIEMAIEKLPSASNSRKAILIVSDGSEASAFESEA